MFSFQLATVDAFNDYFLSICLKIVANMTSTVPASEYMDVFCDRIIPTLEFVPVDAESVSALISALHIQKGSGADVLSAWFIRTSPCMARLVTVLINKCIESSLVPLQWKHTIITPVPKCNQCTSLTHFQPISICATHFIQNFGACFV